MSTEQHESLIPAPLSRTDIARLWREVSGATRMTPGEEEFARRVERAALEVQHALIVQMAEALEQCGRALEDIAMNGADPEDAIDDGVISTLNTTFIAATQYLKGPKT